MEGLPGFLQQSFSSPSSALTTAAVAYTSYKVVNHAADFIGGLWRRSTRPTFNKVFCVWITIYKNSCGMWIMVEMKLKWINDFKL